MVSFCALPLPAYAQKALTIEELLTAQQRWRLELGILYSNIEKTGVSVGQPILVQTGPTQFITLPSAIGEAHRNSDIVVFTPALRYGLRADTELYGRGSAVLEDTRFQSSLGESRTHSTQRFVDAWVGVNHRFVQEGKFPALLGFAEGALAENVATAGSEFVFGKSWAFGVTSYRTIDPIVLSATVAYRLNVARTAEGQRLRPGNSLLIAPLASFAANEQITLSTGVQWLLKEADEVKGVTPGTRATTTDLTLGLGYAFSKRVTLFFNARANISGGGGANVGMTVLYKPGGGTEGGKR